MTDTPVGHCRKGTPRSSSRKYYELTCKYSMSPKLWDEWLRSLLKKSETYFVLITCVPKINYLKHFG